MRIFVFEYITSGGLFSAAVAGPISAASAPRRIDHDLLAEGRAMVTALASDFAALADCDVHVLRDTDVYLALPHNICIHAVCDAAEFAAAFNEQATAADWTVVIAPECDGALLACAERVVALGGRLLSPSPDVIRLTSDKQATAEHLARAGVVVPQGVVAQDQSAPTGLVFPLVIKPRDGAGSQGVQLVRTAAEYAEMIREQIQFRVEEFCPGEAASVTILCGPRGNVPLAPCRQRLSDDGRLAYLGGSTPMPTDLAKRATSLATRAASTLTGAVGYLGVDLVLGPDESGGGDRVIEINPRLTTSYVGLRTAYEGNLAAAMLEVAAGRIPQLGWNRTFDSTRVEW